MSTYTKEELNDIFRAVAKTIDISDKMFDAAEEEYTALGEWIDGETPDYRISIYPQGSFGLGTVVKPISDDDDYDLDIVCQFAEQYNLSAKALKVDIVKPLLEGYRKSSNGLVNKRRCWHVDYDDVPQFHMDIIPAYSIPSGKHIQITDHNEDADTYEYIGSNPSGYIEWFFERCKRQRERLYQNYVKEHGVVVAQADVEKIKRCKVKTPLQRTVQLLKRHRDVMFAEDNTGSKPISIIITTLAAMLYQEEDNIYDAMKNILDAAPGWIYKNMKDGQYYIENPSYAGENFADKWNVHPERATAFFNWVKAAKQDLTDGTLFELNRTQMGALVKKSFGDNTGRTVFNEMAERERVAIAAGTVKVESSSGNLSKAGTIAVPASHHYGK